MGFIDVKLGDIALKNPVIAASGTFGYGEEYADFFNPSLLGGICTKGITLRPREGNKGARMYECSSGLMNSVGLQNPGIKCFLEKELPRMKKYNTTIIANLGGSTAEEYIEGVELLNKAQIDIIELNISCPNVAQGGMSFGIKAMTAYNFVKEIRRNCTKPLMVKLSPNAEDIVEMARLCQEAGADFLSLVNTYKAMAIDINKRKPVFDNITAGLSGPGIKPIALRMVYEVCREVSIPVVGIGGIVSAEDAIEFIMAGATAVQVGTGNFINPFSCINIINGIEEYMNKENLKSLEEIRGCI